MRIPIKLSEQIIYFLKTAGNKAYIPGCKNELIKEAEGHIYSFPSTVFLQEGDEWYIIDKEEAHTWGIRKIFFWEDWIRELVDENDGLNKKLGKLPKFLRNLYKI